MNRTLLLTLLFVVFAVPAFAQIDLPSFAPSSSTGKEGKILTSPLCTMLTNRSDQTILGVISLAPQTLPNGQVVTQKDNFRLKAGEQRQVCAAGPFYEGQRIDLMLRTLLPLFECKTKLDHEIFLDAIKQDSGFKKLSATCS